LIILIANKGIIDIVLLAIELKIKVYSEDLKDDKNAFITKKGGYEIIVNRNQMPERQRFSITREIAHFILHKEEIQDRRVLARENSNFSLDIESEKAADALAADILLPKKYVEECLTERNISKENFITEIRVIKNLAERFKVSKTAAIVRLRETQLIYESL
jgi:Zn-dependent peptidase ImmA (M78 family)